MAMIEQELKEIKEKLENICQTLGIGAVPPLSAAAIKERAKKKALEIFEERKIKSKGGNNVNSQKARREIPD